MPDLLADRKQAIEWAKDLLTNDFVILDTETTGTGPADELVEITIIDQRGEVVLQQRVKPSIPIPVQASNVHHITDADVALAPAAKDVWSQIQKAMADKLVVIYNVPFDTKILTQTANKYGLPYIEARGGYTDAMLWYSQFVGDWNSYHGNYKWQKLPASDHSALGDVLATLKVIKLMAESQS